MATPDNVSTGAQIYGASITQAHTIGAGTDRILMLNFFVGSSADKVTSVTYGGAAMTRVQASIGVAAASTYDYMLVNPAVGTANIVITFTTPDVGSCSVARSYTGVDQGSPIAAAACNTNVFSNTPRTLSIANPAGGLVLGSMGTADRVNTDAFVPGAGATLIAQLTSGAPDNKARVAASDNPGATSVEWSWPGGQRVTAISAIVLRDTVPEPTAAINITEQKEVFSATVNVAGSASATVSITEQKETFAVTAVATAATITTGPFGNNTVAGLLPNLTGLTASIVRLSDMVQVAVLSGLTTGSDARMVLSHAALVAGTTYVVTVKDAAGTIGAEKYTAA